MSKKKLIFHVVSHTHWDREWYQDFQSYRFRLVRMMDDLIKNLEADEKFLYFNLDGQTIVLNDYLEIRPENAGCLKALIKSGRIIIGPWYVMPDSFLVSGESLVKNLQMGKAICDSYGIKAMQCGYMTDIFGHNSQIPQILRGFDIDNAVLYRGIGDYPKDAFIWQGADGSCVYVGKLDRERSYSNFYFTVRWPYELADFDEEDAVRRMKELTARATGLAATDAVLMMDGVDHIDMEPDIPDIIDLLNKNIPDVTFVHSTVDEYFAAVRQNEDKLERIQGALYHVGEKGCNNQVLKNVLSSMVTIKQDNDNAEIMLEKYAEPLNAFAELFSSNFKQNGKNDYDSSPRRNYLDKSWDWLIQNHAHDSICGCSKTEVCQDVLGRLRQSNQISNLLTDDVLQVFARNIKGQEGKTGNILIFNPSQKEYNGAVLLKLPVQTGLSNARFYDRDGKEFPVQIIDRKTVAKPNHRLRKLINFDSIDELTCAAELTVPACSLTAISYDNLITEMSGAFPYAQTQFYAPKRLTGSLKTAHNTFDNGIFVIKVNRSGTLTVQNKATGKIYEDILLFEDAGDCGDGWNYRKPLHDSVSFFRDGNYDYRIESDGALCAVFSITRKAAVPVDSNGFKRSDRNCEMTLTTTVTIVKDSPIIRCNTSLENCAAAHRLRVHFPTGLDTDKFYTKTPYDMCKWDIKAEDYASLVEEETFVHPCQGILYMSDENDSAALYSKGLYEVEVVDNEERSIALTLFRSPLTETGTFQPDETRLLQKLEFDYAFSIAAQSVSQCVLEGEQWRAGTQSLLFTPRENAVLSSSVNFIKDTAQRAIRSFVRLTEDNKMEIRYYDVSGENEKFSITLPADALSAHYVDLKGDIIKEAVIDGCAIEAEIEANKIITLCVSFPNR